MRVVQPALLAYDPAERASSHAAEFDAVTLGERVAVCLDCENRPTGFLEGSHAIVGRAVWAAFHAGRLCGDVVHNTAAGRRARAAMARPTRSRRSAA